MSKNLERDQQEDMSHVAAGLPTKSAKIRALGRAGFACADIARFLGIRYQHARNVLVSAARKEERMVEESGAVDPPAQEWGQVGADGRVMIPAAYRRLLGIEEGGHVLMLLENGEVRLVGHESAIARAQALVAKYVEDESTSTEAFLAERRREATREASGG